MVKKKFKKLSKLYSLISLKSFIKEYHNVVFVNFNYYNKLNYFNLLNFINVHKIAIFNLINIKNKKINIINNINFFKNTNYVLGLSLPVKYTKDFLNKFLVYNHENMDIMYLKFQEFKSLISFSYFVDFIKSTNKKGIALKIIKILYCTQVLFSKILIKRKK